MRNARATRSEGTRARTEKFVCETRCLTDKRLRQDALVLWRAQNNGPSSSRIAHQTTIRLDGILELSRALDQRVLLVQCAWISLRSLSVRRVRQIDKQLRRIGTLMSHS